MSGLLGRLFGRGEQIRTPETRLTEEQATRIALAAAAAHRTNPNLVLREVSAEDGRMTWHFWTPTIGSGLTVTVDDASGDARAATWGRR